MSKQEIRTAYRLDLTISYEQALMMLGRLGFTEYAADQFLFAEG